MMNEVKPAWLKRSFAWFLLPLWVAFAASWAVISARYHVHLDLLPLPDADSLSITIVALLLYVPPILCLLAVLRVDRSEAAASRALRLLGWTMAALLVVATAYAAFIAIGILIGS